jgi:hypothetical protein
MMLIELMPGVADKAEPEAEAKPKRRLALPRRKTTAAASGEDKPVANKTTKKTTAAKKTVKAKA